MLREIRNTAITIIVAGAVAAAALVASASAASAALAVRSPITQTHVVAPVTVTALKEAGSAGVPGYSDEKCESLLHDYNLLVNESEAGLREGDQHRQAYNGELANRVEHQLTENCLLVD
jgi:hypothetical protein